MIGVVRELALELGALSFGARDLVAELCGLHLRLAELVAERCGGFEDEAGRRTDEPLMRAADHRQHARPGGLGRLDLLDARRGEDARLIERVELSDVTSMFAMEEIKSTTVLPLDFVR